MYRCKQVCVCVNVNQVKGQNKSCGSQLREVGLSRPLFKLIGSAHSQLQLLQFVLLIGCHLEGR